MAQHPQKNSEEEKSFLSVIVHSFFVIPFLIAVFCVLLFAGMYLLTRENRTIYDYLEDVKIGGLNKRWQGAFELSKMLSNPKYHPTDSRFISELIFAFEKAKHDDDRVRQYLALAMGRTGRQEFIPTLIEGLREEKEENRASLIYALGMLGDEEALPSLYPYVESRNPRIRSVAIAAIGQIGSPKSVNYLQKGLNDVEPNVQWGSAIALAFMGNDSGREILSNMLQRSYLSQFKEVDSEEAQNLILAAIEASAKLNDPSLMEQIKELSQTDPNMKIRSAALKKYR